VTGPRKRTVESMLDTLDKAGEQAVKTAGDVLTAVQQLTGFTNGWRRMTRLAETWETEAAQARADGGRSAVTTAGALEMCAKQLRAALTQGGDG